MPDPRCAAADPLGGRSGGDAERDPLQWAARFRARLAAERVPVSGSLELTRRCNLDCVHCYLGSRLEREEGRGGEMPTAVVLDLLQELATAGCLNLLLTGGDPMVRHDFATVYGRARALGMLVTVFCNGTLVRDDHVELFRRVPPQLVEISIYGSRPETHDAVTRVPGSWERTLGAVTRLKAAGVDVGLKTILMTMNRAELASMRRLAGDLDVGFRMDAAIMPCLQPSERTPAEYRLDPAEAVELELEDDETAAGWERYAAQLPAGPGDGRLYQCGAGVTNFGITPEGRLTPCLVMPHRSFAIRERGFAAVWAQDVAQAMARRAGPGFPCHACDVRATCTACPATHRLDTGWEDLPGAHACAAARHRARLVRDRAEAATMETVTHD